MGFLGSCDLSIFKVSDVSSVTSDGLRKHAIEPIDDIKSEESAIGWTNFDDISDNSWSQSPPEKGEWLMFSFRKDKRSVPSAVIKKHLDRECAGRDDIKGKKKKELKERLKAQLLAKAEPVPSSCDCAVNLSSGLMMVASSSKSTLDEIGQLFQNSFATDAARVSGTGDVQGVFVTIFREGVDVEVDGETYSVASDDDTTLSVADGEITRTITVRNDADHVERALSENYAITRIRCRITKGDDEAFTWTCTFKIDPDHGVAVTGVKVPVPEKDKENEQDQDELVIMRMDFFATLARVVMKVFEME